MEDVEDKLLALQQTIGKKFAGAEGYRGVSLYVPRQKRNKFAEKRSVSRKYVDR